MLKIGVLISGYGSNLQAIINACDRKEVAGEVVVVISDNAEAKGLERAKKHNIPGFYINPKDFENKDKFEEKVVETLNEHGVQLVCLAGFMRICGEKLLDHFRHKVINIHPSLLPSFPGLHAQKQAIDHGVKVSGTTVHFVDNGCDTGPIILQAAVPVYDDDTEATLSPRILEKEHEIYPIAVKLFAEGKLEIIGRKVYREGMDVNEKES